MLRRTVPAPRVLDCSLFFALESLVVGVLVSNFHSPSPKGPSVEDLLASSGEKPTANKFIMSRVKPTAILSG